MGLFRRDKPNDPPVSIPPLEIPGDSTAGTAGPSAGLDASASAEILAGRKQRRDKGQSRGPRGEKLSDGEKALLATFERLYDPEVWEGVVCAPADTMLAMSGRAMWQISDRERKTLSVTASMTARCFAVDNPKWLALIMLSITLTQIYGTRAMMHMAELRKEREAAKRAEQEKKG